MNEMSDSDYIQDNVEKARDYLVGWVEKNENDPDAKAFVDDIKDVIQTIPVQNDRSLKMIIPDNTKETIKESMSQGKWNKVDPETGAAGVYQFTNDQWQFISASDPSLGLTENGRVSKDPSEQEKAMNWYMASNAKFLIAQGLEVNEESLLGAHRFGVENISIIYDSKYNEKLSTAIGDESKSPVFKNFNTVGDVKRYLSGQIRKAK
jgi:hypothetical protein